MILLTLSEIENRIMIEYSPILLTFVITFLFSVSIMFNMIFILLLLVSVWYFFNSINERQELLEKTEAYENTKYIVNNVEQIGEHVLQLKYLLEEVKTSNVMYNEPIYNDLMKITESLLQDIYIFDEGTNNERET